MFFKLNYYYILNISLFFSNLLKIKNKLRFSFYIIKYKNINYHKNRINIIKKFKLHNLIMVKK